MGMKKLDKLRTEMKNRGVKVFYATTSDAHGSEYICEHDNIVKFVSGFTGTNGTLYITQKKAELYTDGRYYIQAERELRATGIKLIRKNGTCVTPVNQKESEEIAAKLWKDRPARPANPIWIYEKKWAGESAEEKLSRVKKQMRKEKLSEICVRDLSDIAWVLNLRGSDIPYNPVFYSYLIMGKTTKLYLQTKSINDKVRKYLKKLNIEIFEYNAFEPATEYSDIISRIKTHKSESEINHMRKCGVRDGVYVTKFIRWLKKHAADGITEMDAANYLDALRATDKNYVSLSFPTISAYGKNGAIVHYEVTAKTNAKIKPRGLFLVDSGGQYLDGTTDVTRTIALGPLTDEEKLHYTLVCMGMLRALNAKFTSGTASTKIDEVARKPLKKYGLDFDHGTGHGVGYCGYVHEGPARINRKGFTRKPYKFTGGEVVSDEPGVYIEGKHGVRIENMVHVGKNGFENLTWVPLDEDAIDWSIMSKKDKELFENYQKAVMKKIGRYL